MKKKVNYTCKTCQKPATMILKTKEEVKEFTEWTKGFNCEKCSYEFWRVKLEAEPWKLRQESSDFQQRYRVMEKKYKKNEQ